MSTVKIENIWDVDVPGAGYAAGATLARTKDGGLVAVYMGNKRHHCCPFGQIQMITSQDEGKTWTWPRVLVDSILDDRDGGILVTSKGTIIVSWFSSLAWEWVMKNHPTVYHGGRYVTLDAAEDAEWKRRHANLTDELRQQELGGWCIRSTDGGVTWSTRIPTMTGSPHGPCELSDGRLLYVGKKIASNLKEAYAANNPKYGGVGGPYSQFGGVAESTDDGQTWKIIGDILPAPGHEILDYHELHAVEAVDGTIIAHIRNHNELHKGELLQTESQDGGRTWSTPHPIGLWGYPAFLSRLSDGRLMTSFSHRREPNGNKVAVSEDNGKTWFQPEYINKDSAMDFGYPSTVELSHNQFISMWYDLQDRDLGFMRLARWNLT